MIQPSSDQRDDDVAGHLLHRTHAASGPSTVPPAPEVVERAEYEADDDVRGHPFRVGRQAPSAITSEADPEDVTGQAFRRV